MEGGCDGTVVGGVGTAVGACGVELLPSFID